jgi:cyanophycinase
VPYGGSSAGAAIAASQAIVGGWRAARGDDTRQILFEGAGEGMRPLTVLPGLGLVRCAVDVHASQWGTLSRLVQAVDLGLVSEGVAIDENTTLIVSGAAGRVAGAGHVFHARRQAGGVFLTIHVAGDELRLGRGDANA